MQQILRMASAKGITTKYLVKGKLLKFTGNRPCQNVVMKCDKLAYVDVRSIKDIVPTSEPTGRLILFCD